MQLKRRRFSENAGKKKPHSAQKNHIKKEHPRQSTHRSKSKGDALLTGRINLIARGSGIFRIREKEETIEIPSQFLNTALHGDTVEISITKPPHGDRDGLGKVVRVVKRAKILHTGIIERAGTNFLFKGSDVRLATAIKIVPSTSGENPESLANTGAIVAVKITRYDAKGTPEGIIEKVVGPANSPETASRAFAIERGFDSAFPKDVGREAEQIHKTFDIKKEIDAAVREIANSNGKRVDMRGALTCTIDPADAKDFDDALSLQTHPDGSISLGIHIADVAHFVRPETALDREALSRATSVYLVDRTIPMLPEVLSNDLCSLTPNTDKLALSAVVDFDKNLHIKHVWFGNTIIHSSRRFTYEEAFEVLTTGDGEWHETLKTINAIAKNLRDKRMQAGALSLDSDEVKFTLDADGFPIAVYKKTRNDAHKLIEECMLLANTLVAEHLSENKGKPNKNAPTKSESMLFRVHEEPTLQKMNDLSIYLKSLGHHAELKGGIIPAATLKKAIDETKDQTLKDILQSMIVRSMQKALYSTQNKGHFGLAVSHYTHFTSPIRRYPDTVIHRLLKTTVGADDAPKDPLKNYTEVAAHTTEREIDAQEAERASDKYFQALYMTSKVGTVVSGIITGFSDRGLFVRDNESFAEGFVRFRDMEDRFVADRKKMIAVGTRSKKIFSLGQAVQVKIEKVSPERREIDYTLVS